MITRITTKQQVLALPVGTVMLDTDNYLVVKSAADEYHVISPRGDGDNLFVCADELTGELQGEPDSPFFPMEVVYIPDWNHR